MDDSSCTRWQKQCFCRPEARGFSLVELLAACAVLVVLLAIGIPSYNAVTAASREYVTLSTLYGVLAEARSTAVSKKSRVTLCRASPLGACMGDATSGALDWAQTGILMFVDMDQDRRYSAGEPLLRHISLDDGISLIWNRGDSLTYEPDGTVIGGSNGTFQVLIADDLSCSLVVSMMGRVRQQCER